MSNDAIDYINRDIVNVKNEIKAFKENVEQGFLTLNKVVLVGNGQPSLVQQVTQLREGASGLRGDIQALDKSIKEYQNDQKNKSTLAWHFKTAILVALITSFATFYQVWQDHKNPPQDAQVTELFQKLDTLIKAKSAELHADIHDSQQAPVDPNKK